MQDLEKSSWVQYSSTAPQTQMATTEIWSQDNRTSQVRVENNPI